MVPFQTHVADKQNHWVSAFQQGEKKEKDKSSQKPNRIKSYSINWFPIPETRVKEVSIELFYSSQKKKQ